MPQEALNRRASFGATFLLMPRGEMAAPRRSLARPNGERWFANLALVALNTRGARSRVSRETG